MGRPGKRDPQAGERLARPEPGLGAERADQVHRALGAAGRILQRQVAEGCQLCRGPAGQVDAVGRREPQGDHEVLVHRLGQEREQRSQHPRHAGQGQVERGERRVAVGRIVRA